MITDFKFICVRMSGTSRPKDTPLKPNPAFSPEILVATPGGETLELRQLFNRLDSDNNGSLTSSELLKGCEILGFSLSSSEVEVYWSEMY